jgi:hypothetical protein
MHFQTSQCKAANIQAAFAGAEIYLEIDGFLIVEAHIPAIIGVVSVGAMGRLLHHQMAAEAAGIVAHVWPQAGPIVMEIGVHQLRRAAADVEFAGTHLEFHVNHLSLVEIDGARLSAARTFRLPLNATC